MATNEQLQMTITAVDHASPTLAKIASETQKMGKTAEQAGKQASKALQDQGKSTDDLNKRMAAAGAAFTTGAALLGQWSRSAQDAAAIQRQLEAAINASGESYAQYADQIQAVGERAVQLGQDDEAASQAIAALTEITGSASTALSQMGLVFDLAAAKHLSLENAAELVGKVLEGNTGILQRYGIVVEEGASSAEALAAVQAQVAGQAEANATSYARLREELSNVTDSIGAAVGGFAPLLAILPGVSSGFTLIGAAAGALAPGLTAAGAASKALSLALGPVGLVAAAGLATFAIYELVTADNDLDRTMKASAGATTAFSNELAKLGATGSKSADDFAKVSDAFAQVLADQLTLQQAIQAGGGGTGGIMGELSAKDINTIRDSIIDLFNNPFIDADKITTELLRVFKAFQDGDIDGEELRKTIEGDKVAWSQFAVETDKVSTKIEDTVSKFKDQQAALKENVQLLTEYADATEHTKSEAAAFAADLDEIAAAGGEAAGFIGQWIKGLNDSSLSLDEVEQRAAKLVITLRQQAHESFPGTEKSMGDYGAQVLETADILAKQTKITQEATVATDDLGVAAGSAGDAMAGMGDAIPDAGADVFTVGLRGIETALERVARGSTSAAVQLRAFKDVQDGIISHQDVFNQQYSEYGSQLSDIERAQKILNERTAEGQTLTKDQQEFLDGAAAAQERLTGGQEDAAIAAGELAVKYGENMSLGDKMNENLGNLDGTIDDLTGSIDALTDALGGIPPDTEAEVSVAGLADNIADTEYMTSILGTLDGTSADPDVSVSGLGDALSGASNLYSLLGSLDGKTATTTINNVIRTVFETTGSNPYIGGPGGGRDGGVMGYANGGVVMAELAEVGPERLKFRDGGTAIVADHGVYAVPRGTFVTPTAGTMSNMGKGGSIAINFYGPVNSGSDLDAFLSEAERLVRARFAGLGI